MSYWIVQIVYNNCVCMCVCVHIISIIIVMFLCSYGVEICGMSFCRDAFPNAKVDLSRVCSTDGKYKSKYKSKHCPFVQAPGDIHETEAELRTMPAAHH